ncbi:Gfo/Idh/MocA family protein [Cohnella zeiphila]|uniref:Gfo/Idh/MocA family oxidoreductase n=1 Tax=Cohnella zeiphila TaxID=2761120 RepID=A0A7X0SS66_9BACL|nr:Gfo/Idh/MocA family oxidoreductase [Cohnella zeiphila]MBB6735163.1 Gfo/Idh/MocA family oxidoreductase [Cohnella zeiphila]
MTERMRIGIVGTDTSHSIAFAELLNDRSHRYRVPGGEVVLAYPGGSPDFELSRSRVAGFAEEMSRRFGVWMADRPEQVAAECDAVLLLSADGRVHLEQFEAVAVGGKPVFIDKPLACSLKEATAIAELARAKSVPVMSSSALRYAEALTKQLQGREDDRPVGVDCYAPMFMEPTQRGYFWYGIHSAEMLYAILGTGCRCVRASGSGDAETIVGVWSDGTVGTIRGSRSGGFPFAAAIARERSSSFANIASEEKPFYASLLEQVMEMFRTGVPAVGMSETLEIIRFVEAANQSRENGGGPVELEPANS